MASRFEIVNEKYTEELKDEWKQKHEEKHGVLEERFQKVWVNESNCQAKISFCNTMTTETGISNFCQGPN